MTTHPTRLTPLLIALLPALSGCLSTGFPGVTVAPDEPVTALTLNAASCAPDDEARLRSIEVVGAELVDQTTLLVRVDREACPGVQFRVCADDIVIETDPGIWELTLQAHAIDYTRCGGTRTSVLRVDLSSSTVAGDLDRVAGVHGGSSDGTGEGSHAVGSVSIDLRLLPD